MLEYKRVPTSAEVWAVIRARHPKELQVFSTISEPDGDPHGNSNRCRMMTEYGFDDSDMPIIGAQTTWKKHPEKSYERVNEKHEYWVCVAINNEEN